MQTSILVTGARGQIGCALVKRLAELKFDVYELDCVPGYGRQYLHYDLVDDDLNELRHTRFDILVHLAGDKSDPHVTGEASTSVFKSNVVATARLLDVLKDTTGHIIYASTISVYGDADVPYHEEQTLRPRTLYGTSKVAAEMLFRCYGIADKTCILRIAQVIGPGTPENVAPVRMIHAARNDEVRLSCTDATVRDYVYLDDVIDGFVSAIRLCPSGAFNIGSGKPTTLTSLATLIAESAGVPLRQIAPTAEEFEIWMSVARARAQLGYAPSWTVEQWVEHELRSVHTPTRQVNAKSIVQRSSDT